MYNLSTIQDLVSYLRGESPTIHDLVSYLRCTLPPHYRTSCSIWGVQSLHNTGLSFFSDVYSPSTIQDLVCYLRWTTPPQYKTFCPIWGVQSLNNTRLCVPYEVYNTSTIQYLFSYLRCTAFPQWRIIAAHDAHELLLADYVLVQYWYTNMVIIKKDKNGDI